MKIAILVDESGSSVPYSKGGIIEIYVFGGSGWYCSKAATLDVDTATNITEVRERIHTVMAVIEDCKVFVVETMKTLPIGIFDGYGITVWNHTGVPTEALDFIREQEANKALTPKSCCDTPRCNSTCSSDDSCSSGDSCSCAATPANIENVSEGHYKVDLAQMLKSDRSLNSKQILIPFLQSTEFQQLEIICEHVPRWFEHELGTLKLQVHIEESGDGFCHAIVSPN